ncbi:MAG: hypothetical protein FWE20_10405 [Defluviitaleaceae bacterium]|nr:hypothetical protein [Defluviitaleaceae bacterium]
MAERSGFFNGRQMRDPDGAPLLHEDGSPRFDREYTAAEFAEMFSLYLTNGIRNGGNSLRVVADNGLVVRVLPGDAMINGYFYKLLDDGRIFQIERNLGGSARTDRIVLRLDLRQDEGRRISLELKRGDTSLTRSNEFWELAIADISVPLNFTNLTQAQITDRRLDPNLCGLIHSLVAIDTTGLLAQLDSFFSQQRQIWTAQTNEYGTWFQGTSDQWNGWFNQIKAELFAQTNTIFEDWSRRAGYTIETDFFPGHPGGFRVVETLLNTINRSVLATKTTQFNAEGTEINEALVWSEPPLSVNKRTTFGENRVIETITNA